VSFTEVKELGMAEVRDCGDPDCVGGGKGTAEPEQDGDHKYWICQVCGFEFGWERLESQTMAVSQDGSCSVGIPTEVRRAASGAHDRAAAQLDAEERRLQPVDLGLSIGRRPGL
jgi:hypothetical protein